MEQQVNIQIYYVELKAYVKRGLTPLFIFLKLLNIRIHCLD